MKKNEIIAKVTSAVNTATIKVKKHSPEILVVAGLGWNSRVSALKNWFR